MINVEKSCCFTGYRPEKFGFDLSPDEPKYREFMARLMTAIADMIENGCTCFYTGMAMGFDIIAAEHIATIKLLNKDIRLIAVIPFKGQQNGFGAEWKKRYEKLLSECDEIITLSDKYTRDAFSKRNRYMVDRSLYCLTYFDGKSGGTQNTVKYAVKNGRQVLNIFETDPLAEVKSHFSRQLLIYPPEE